MNQQLKGKSAIVTGSGRGIGRAVAIELAESGVNVALNDLPGSSDIAEVADECRKHGVDVLIVEADVSKQSEVERIVAEAVNHFGQLDIAVSNAAYSDRELFWTAEMSGFERTIAVTMWGAFYLVRAAAPYMVKQKAGSIVVIGSLHSERPIPGSMAYNMSKGAIEQMAKTAATELCQHRVRVNIVQPGWIDTPGERKFFSEEKLSQMGSDLPMGRMGTPKDIARGVLFLCDPGSEYITGSTLKIDGGIDLPTEQMHRLQMPE